MDLRRRPVHSGRLERFLGAEKIEHLQRSMRGWYGRPIYLTDVPGNVWVTAQGDFVGNFVHGSFFSALESIEDNVKRMLRGAIREVGRPSYGTMNAGFASISDALSRASQGFSQRRQFNKAGSTGVVAASSSLWRLGNQPAAGATPGAAPGGTAFTSSSTGALAFANPAAGTLRLVGADAGANVIGNTLLAYDLLFGVAKTMNSTATEAVTGVPTRYQSTTASAEDYIGDNFGFIQVGGTALAATAHNWTTCTYLDQANAASTLPSVTGNSAAIVNRLDQPVGQWFVPLESGDVGIKAWTQMQASAAVATGVIWFMIGHPLGFMSFPQANGLLPFDWLTNRDQAPRIFDNACIAFMEPLKPATTATTYTGRLVATSTSS